MLDFLYNLFWFKEIMIGILIGVTEGVTEFLPISSTAHMRLVAFGLFGGGDIDSRVGNVFQLAALIAILQFFWTDLTIYYIRIREYWQPGEFQLALSNAQSWIRGTQPASTKTIIDSKNSQKTQADIHIAQLIVATIPVGIAGLFLRKLVDSLRVGVVWIGVFLILGAVLMLVAEYVYRPSKKDGYESRNLTFWQTVGIGLFQALAIFPGISRSGATISGGYIMNLNKEYLVRTVFLLSIPALFLAGFKDTLSLVGDLGSFHFWPNQNLLGSGNLSIVSIMVGAIFAYFSALYSLRWLIGFLQTNNFNIFVVYRIVLGLVLIFLVK
jgi:undecaprenyl-diphosphatase